MLNARFIDEIYGGYGDGGGGVGGAGVVTEPAPAANALEQQQHVNGLLPTHNGGNGSSSSGSGSFVGSLLRKGILWCIIATIAAIGIAATYISIRFKLIDAHSNDNKLELEEKNTAKQKFVLQGVGAGIAAATILLVVTRIAVKWHF